MPKTMKVREIDSIDVVALRFNQKKIGPPKEFFKWGDVTCDECHEKFSICQEVHFTDRALPKGVIKKLEKRLAQDHAIGRRHSDAYNSTWGWESAS